VAQGGRYAYHAPAGGPLWPGTGPVTGRRLPGGLAASLARTDGKFSGTRREITGG